MNVWFFAKCLVLGFYGYGFFLFCHRLLGTKASPKTAAAVLVLYPIGFDYIFLNRVLGVNYFVGTTCSWLGLMLLIQLLFRGNPAQKLAIAIVLYVIQQLTAYAVVPLLGRCVDVAFDHYFHHVPPLHVYYWISTLRYAICVTLLEVISRRCSSLGGNLPRRISGLLLLPMAFIVLALEIAAYIFNHHQLFHLLYVYRNLPLPSFVFQFGDPVMLFLLSVLGLAASLRLVFGTNHAMLQLMNEQRLALQVAHYQALENQQKELRHVRHDMRNHVISLMGLLEGKRVDAAKAYLNHLSEKSGLLEDYAITGNPVADAVLYVKGHEARQSGIDFQCDLQRLGFSGISDFDLSVILGNGLDNAIEACKRIKQPDRRKFVHIQTGAAKHFYILEMKNSMENAGDPSVALMTRKAPAELHGMGLDSMKAIVEKYRGTMDIELQPGVFRLSLMLPLASGQADRS
ncbi:MULTISPECIES: sensor histidine kinase [Paenibacillus]|uniref:sensor histidine kinase n=1 Tax=Paenibacillus TaxID=44249 RepID=UPI002FE3A60A